MSTKLLSDLINRFAAACRPTGLAITGAMYDNTPTPSASGGDFGDLIQASYFKRDSMGWSHVGPPGGADAPAFFSNLSASNIFPLSPQTSGIVAACVVPGTFGGTPAYGIPRNPPHIAIVTDSEIYSMSQTVSPSSSIYSLTTETAIQDVCFAPNGNFYVACVDGADGKILKWTENLSPDSVHNKSLSFTGEIPVKIMYNPFAQGIGQIWGITNSSDGRLCSVDLAGATSDDTFHTTIQISGVSFQPSDICLCPHSATVYISSRDASEKGVFVLSAFDGTGIKRIMTDENGAPLESITYMCYCRSTGRIYATSSANTAKIYVLNTVACCVEKTIEVDDVYSATSITYLEGCDRIAVGTILFGSSPDYDTRLYFISPYDFSSTTSQYLYHYDGVTPANNFKINGIIENPADTSYFDVYTTKGIKRITQSLSCFRITR